MEVLISNSVAELIQKLSQSKPKVFRILHEKVAILSFNGKIFAFEPKCPHFDFNLETASPNSQNEIVCPWHSYRFSLISGIESQNRCKALKLYPITERDGKVYIQLDNL